MNEFAEILNLFIANVISLLLTCGDSEDWSKIYGYTTDYQQAPIVFDVAANMVRMCPVLNRQVKFLASQTRIVYQPTNSFYQALSAEPNSSTISIFIVSYSMSYISSQPVNTLMLWPSVPEMQERSRFTFLSPLLEQIPTVSVMKRTRRSRVSANTSSRISARKTSSNNLNPINGSNRLSVGCQWGNSMPVSSMKGGLFFHHTQKSHWLSHIFPVYIKYQA